MEGRTDHGNKIDQFPGVEIRDAIVFFVFDDKRNSAPSRENHR